MSLLSGPGTFKHIVQIESPKLTFYLNSVIKLKITLPSSEWCGIQLCSRASCNDQEGDGETGVLDNVRKVCEEADQSSKSGQCHLETGGGSDLVLENYGGTWGPDVFLNEIIDLRHKSTELMFHDVLCNIWVDISFHVAECFFPFFNFMSRLENIIEFAKEHFVEFCLFCI